MSPLASFCERRTSVTLYAPLKGIEALPSFFDQGIYMGICFLVFFRSLRPFDALNEGTKEKAYPLLK